MSQSSSDKFVYFTVGILKDSLTLDALKQDMLKHHMIDHPGQLIALRLTEYYEMMNHGIVQPVVQVPAIMVPIEGGGKEKLAFAASSPTSPSSEQSTDLSSPSSPSSTPVHQFVGKIHDVENIVSPSLIVTQNADEAADYWNPL